ncbi:hypothetical protein ANANG_G00311310 [Anguilla anguilla]|uniref:PPM-type phosphatase domain-containing protein n=1 Tax=Anguilla anguilla TaxID=7936 RepID=A0A9D3LJE0_ANGAN|nr:hypothetical protein ANANG_G00311310 [Anguilla anguilla]
MLTRVKSAVASFMGGIMAGGSNGDNFSGSDLPLKFPYMRPEFLGLSQDEIECSADHIARPILILKETKRLPWATGYAEVINAGKSTLNEDQACCEVVLVKRKAGSSTPGKTPTTKRRSSLPNGEGLGLRESSDSDGLAFHYWALFDGHAGSGAAVVASKLLQHHIVEQLQDKKVEHESLVIGAMENAFKEMDAQIEREKAVYSISGGCTALVVVFLLGKLYVGNAGDSRAIIIRNGEVVPMSSEFTPESERQRLQFLGYMQPHLLGNEFTHLEFPRRVQRKEVGKRMLYRDFTMSGWAYKTIEDEDLKFPLIYGEGKKRAALTSQTSRLPHLTLLGPATRAAPVSAATTASRGERARHGDHRRHARPRGPRPEGARLQHLHQALPLLLPGGEGVPADAVRAWADDVLVMGTDGLWDVLSNEEVSEAVAGFLANCDPDDLHRYTMAAQDLVMRARGC